MHLWKKIACNAEAQGIATKLDLAPKAREDVAMAEQSFVPEAQSPQGDVAAKRKQRRLLVGVLLLLYAITGVGGWVSHSQAIHAEAERRYQDVLIINQKERARNGPRWASAPDYIELHENGHYAGVNWCVPVLPGVCLADSYYAVGPLYAEGGVKVVIWYGWGSWDYGTIFGWIT